jgi:putative heme-binding domain-containing protein
LLHQRQDPGAVPLLKLLLRASREPRGRLQALYSLDGLRGLDATDLSAAVADDSPPVREHAVFLAEPRLMRAPGLRAQVAGLADDPSLRVRFQVAFTLGELGGAESREGLTRIARRDAADPWVRTAVLSSASADPLGLFDRLEQDGHFATTDAGVSLLAPLAVVIGARGQVKEIARVLEVLAREGHTEPSFPLVLGLGDGLARAGRKLTDLRPDLSPAVIPWLDRLWNEAINLAQDESIPPDRRAKAVALLGLAPFARAKAILPRWLTPSHSPQVQAAAGKALAGFDRPEVASLLLKPWKRYGPSQRAQVVGYLLGRRAWIGPLLQAIGEGSVPAGEIPPARQALLLKDHDPEIRCLAQSLFGDRLPGSRSAVLARYKPATERPGDPDRGQSIFDRECLACHKLGERGHAVGPNLASVRRKTPEEILLNILDPNREVSPEFLEYAIAMDDGRVVTGLIAAESPSSLTLRGREANEQIILRRNISEIAGTGKSLMPEGLELRIPAQEMADLIAYLLKIQD